MRDAADVTDDGVPDAGAARRLGLEQVGILQPGQLLVGIVDQPAVGAVTDPEVAVGGVLDPPAWLLLASVKSATPQALETDRVR
jgi:hypothetical protein